MAAKIGSLNIDLAIDAARFNQGIGNAQGKLGQLGAAAQKIGKAISSAFVASGVVSFAQTMREASKRAIDLAGNLGEEAAAIGVSTRALQEFRFAATQMNLSQKEMDDGLAQLTRRTGDAAQGVKETQDAFARLGINIYDSMGKVRSASDLFPEIADGLAKIPSEAERAAITVDLFGRSGQRMAALLAAGAAGIEKLRKAAHELGIVLSEEEIAKADEVADKLAALNYAIDAQQNKKLLENADAILRFEESLGDLKLRLIESSNTLQNWVDRFDAYNAENAASAQEFYSRVGDYAASLGTRLANFAENAISSMSRMVKGVRLWVSDKLNAVWSSVTERIDQVKRAFFNLYDAVVGHSYVPDMVDGIQREMARLDQVMVDPAEKAAKKTAEKFRDMAGEVRQLLDELFPEIAAFNEFKSKEALLDGAGLDPATLNASRSRLMGAYFGGTEGDAPVSDSVLNAPALDSMLPKIDLAGKSLDELAGKAKAAFSRMEQMGSDVFAELGYQLRGLVLGAQSLGDALRNLGMRMAEQLFDSAWSSLGKGLSIPGFATGTPSAPRGLALVGERGPELVSFRGGERVFTNGETRRMMAGAGGRGNVSMTVIANDADSFRRSQRQISRDMRRKLNVG